MAKKKGPTPRRRQPAWGVRCEECGKVQEIRKGREGQVDTCTCGCAYGTYARMAR